MLGYVMLCPVHTVIFPLFLSIIFKMIDKNDRVYRELFPVIFSSSLFRKMKHATFSAGKMMERDVTRLRPLFSTYSLLRLIGSKEHCNRKRFAKTLFKQLEYFPSVYL